MSFTTLDANDPKHAHISERLHTNIIAWLSTVRPDGRPHLVPVWFLWDGHTILIFSKPDQKIRNLSASQQVIVALDNTYDGEDDEVIIIEGLASLLPAGEVATTLEPYAAKYAGEIANLGWTAASMATEYTRAIRITPTRFL